MMEKAIATISTLAVVMIFAPVGSAGDGVNSPNLDFENDIMPVLTKAGCNAGACHGAAIGRGGFKLSLYGGDPKADFDAIVRQMEGRRVNLAHPEKSLVLLKPTRTIKHGGGTVINPDDESAQRLVNWIKQGAGQISNRRLTRVDITPKTHVAGSLDHPVQVAATAHYADGTSQDVSKWTVFTPEDSSAVEVDEDMATIRRRGRHIVVARYLTEVVPIELIVPLNDGKVDLAREPRRNVIDEEILRSLAILQLPPSPLIDDRTFLRRITLDLTGRLPTVAQLKAFRADVDPKKREKLVDQLLQSDQFVEYMTLDLAKLFRIRPQVNDSQGAIAYHKWIFDQVRANSGYDKIARSVITASGDTHTVGPANFYRTVNGADQQAELMSELFMGSRMKCANCHNHPLDRWTQDDYHGLAAIFAKVEGNRVIVTKPTGSVTHPVTLEPAKQRIPGERFLPNEGVNGRVELADWLTAKSNPYFAKAIVNRLWKRMMGRGLVEPVDDFRATNPATHPALLDKLADDFANNGYDLRHTLRVIASSAAYSRSANALPRNKDDDRFYSHAIRRPLEPEVLADAISDVLGVAEKYGQEPLGTRAIALIDPKTISPSLDILGRCGRDASCEGAPATASGLTQMLQLLNGELLNERIAHKDGRLAKLIAAGHSPLAIVDAFYLVALGRPPTAKEAAHWKKQFDETKSAKEQQDRLEDFVWSLLTAKEFVTNH